ncbi:hypothetical protein CPZ32_18845 [Bacillus cereus]|nr:hypothetical protein CPZ32_18845 [Bacillus cereus]
MAYYTFPGNLNNGVLGEYRTESILANDFYVWSIKPDVYGADHFVIKKNLERGPMYLPRVAHIQSKFRKKINSDIDVNFENVFIKDNRLEGTNTHGWRPNPLYFLFVHHGDIDNEIVYFFSARDIVKWCKVDYKDKKIIVNSHNTDLTCCYKDQNKSNLKETLDVIREQIEIAEILDSSVISEQLKIEHNRGYSIEYDGEIFTHFENDNDLPEEVENLKNDFEKIKIKSKEILIAIEPLIMILRQLTLETNPSILSKYYYDLSSFMSNFKELDKDITSHPHGLKHLIGDFYWNHYDKVIDEV